MSNIPNYRKPQDLINALDEFKKAWDNLAAEWDNYVDRRPEYSTIGSEKYPFNQCFAEKAVEVNEWKDKFTTDIYKNLDK